MGLVQKKDEREYIDGIEVIGRGEGPDGLEENAYDIVAGQTAEDISGTTAAREGELELEADPNLVSDDEDEESSDGTSDKGTARSHAHETPRSHFRGDDGHDGGNGDPEAPSAKGGHGKLIIAGAVIAVIVAAILGYFFGSGGFSKKVVGTSSVQESQLDDVIATWTYGGATHEVSVREAIESSYSVDEVKSSDGTYPVPSGEEVLSYIRDQILLEEADSRGIEATDEECASYAEDNLGTSDYSGIAQQYKTTEDQAKRIVKERVLIQKLYTEVVGDTGAKAPEAPSEPADGNNETATAEYASYIIDLAGDEWDAEKGAWASDDGPIASALADSGFTGQTATYTQAQTAYFAAYSDYVQSASKSSQKWIDWANGLFSNAGVNLFSACVSTGATQQ